MYIFRIAGDACPLQHPPSAARGFKQPKGDEKSDVLCCTGIPLALFDGVTGASASKLCSLRQSVNFRHTICGSSVCFPSVVYRGKNLNVQHHLPIVPYLSSLILYTHLLRGFADYNSRKVAIAIPSFENALSSSRDLDACTVVVASPFF